MRRWSSLIARIDRATLRERVLLFGAFLAVLASLWYQLVMTPVMARQAIVALALDDIKNHSDSGQSAAGLEGTANEYASLKVREAAMTRAVAEADAALNDVQFGMLSPSNMMAVLTDVLHEQKDLTLVLLRNLPVEPLLPVAGGEKSGRGAAVVGPFVHPVEIVVRGSYLNVLAYLKTLESRAQGFHWRRFELAPTETGLEYRIEFTTVSMESNWLGV